MRVAAKCHKGWRGDNLTVSKGVTKIHSCVTLRPNARGGRRADVENSDFIDEIGNDDPLGGCDVLVALIGKRWVGRKSGVRSRLDDAKDYVRLEVSTALARHIPVIPVLVDGMTMPDEDSLPAPVQAITQRQAIEISETRFDYDVDQLITAIRRFLNKAEVKS